MRMGRCSHIISLLLLAVVALTAQSAAAARTMPDAHGQMVICTGTGPTMVYFDANGEPTGAPVICPDYALSLIVALGMEDVSLASTRVWGTVQVQLSFVTARSLQSIAQKARGPPVLI